MFDICDLIYLNFKVLKKVIQECSEEDLFHAFIVMPNDVTFKCQLFFSKSLQEKRQKHLNEPRPVPLKTIEDATKRILNLMESLMKPEELMRKDISTSIFVKILNDNKKSWRAVKALEFDKDVFFIQDYPMNLPDLNEVWEFPMNSIVKVRAIEKDGKTYYVANELFKF